VSSQRYCAPQRARDDRRGLFARQRGPGGGDALAGRIEASLDLIEGHPAIGAARPKLGAHIRIWPIPPYVLIYALGEDTLQILRFLHANNYPAGGSQRQLSLFA